MHAIFLTKQTRNSIIHSGINAWGHGQK